MKKLDWMFNLLSVLLLALLLHVKLGLALHIKRGFSFWLVNHIYVYLENMFSR